MFEVVVPAERRRHGVSAARPFTVLSEFARTLVAEHDVDLALPGLTRTLTDLLDLVGCAVLLADGDRVRYAAAAPRVAALAALEESQQAGAGVDAYRTGDTVAVADLGHDGRWPALSRAALRTGITAVAGVPMTVGDDPAGALVLYATDRHEWSACDVAVATLLADMLTVYLANADGHSRQVALTAQLQTALDSRVVIEQAKGVVAEQHGIDVDQAFTVLRSHARRHRVALRAVAEAVVGLGLKV